MLKKFDDQFYYSSKLSLFYTLINKIVKSRELSINENWNIEFTPNFMVKLRQNERKISHEITMVTIFFTFSLVSFAGFLVVHVSSRALFVVPWIILSLTLSLYCKHVWKENWEPK